MSSQKEIAVHAVFDLVVAALPLALVVRNQERPDEIGPDGFVNVVDGDPGSPDEDLSPHTYNYRHAIGLELAAVAASGLTKEAVLDAMSSAIGQAVAANRTLGGRVDFAEVEAPVSDNADALGTDTVRWADGAVIAHYATQHPMG